MHPTRAAAIAWCLVCAACAGAPARSTRRAAASSTHYRVGDYVVYRYSGTFTPEPVLLREQIGGRDGNRLRIDVTLTRGGDQRRWIQVVTDTPENERNNVVDALYEWRDGRFVRLENEGNRDLFRLYAWTLLMPGGRAKNVHKSPCEQQLAGKRFACQCTSGRNVWHGRPIDFEDSTCADFLWTHGPAKFWDEQSGRDILQAQIVEFGRRAAEPMSPK